MTKLKIEEDIELTDEEKALLEKYSNEGSTLPQMPHLVINTSTVDNDGNEIPIQTFNISGTNIYKKKIKIRPIKFVSRLLDMRQDAKGSWKTVNETIYFSMNEEPIDSAGGVGCGRLLGKSTHNFTEEQKKANKAKAQFYGYLFGVATIEGHAPTLVSFRVPAGKAVGISNALNTAKKGNRKLSEIELTLALVPNKKDKKNIHPDIDITFNPDEILKVDRLYINSIKTVDEYIRITNERVRQSHIMVAKQRQDGTVVSRVTSKVTAKKVIEEDEDLAEDIGDDEIPF